MITLVAWIEYQWTDYKLKWQPSEYGGIKDIRVPGNANAIWKPDVLLYNRYAHPLKLSIIFH